MLNRFILELRKKELKQDDFLITDQIKIGYMEGLI